MPAQLNTFDGLSAPCQCLDDLTDGVILTEAMAQIAPAHFDTSSLKRGVGGNSILCGTNLQKLLRNLRDFYSEELGQTLSPAAVDSALIASEKDPTETAKLVELVLGAAVQCEQAGAYIARIMQVLRVDCTHTAPALL